MQEGPGTPSLPGDEFALLVDAVEDYAIFLLSPDGVIRTWNRGAARVMGYAAEEIIGEHFSRFYTQADLDARKTSYELETAKQDGRVEDEGWRVRSDGRHFWANTVITALRDSEGHLLGFTKVTRDLTERKQAEERLRQSEEVFRLLVASVREYAIFMLDPEGKIATWNAGANRIMGYTEEEILDRHFSTFYPEEAIRARKPDLELETAQSEGWVEDEGWRVRKDGSRFWANTVITALRDSGGRLFGFTKVTRDLTERKKADEKLRQSEEVFRLLVASVREYAIFMLDPEGKIATWNAGAHRIKGYTEEEIVGRHFSTFYPEEDVEARKPEIELEIAQRDGWVEDEGWRVRKDGSRFWANVVITAVRDESGQLIGYTKVTRDLTERKQSDEMQRSLLEQREARLHAEEERRRAEASYIAAKEANRAKDEFLMTLSHELRTPMTAILGWSRLLPTLVPGDAMFAEAIDAIGRSAKLQASLIDDVLDVSRIVAGKLRLTRETLDIERLLAGAVDAVRPTAYARGVELRTTFQPGLGSFVADATRMHQVIWNLLTNAVKFTPKGGWVEVRATLDVSLLRIAVEDSGEGIAPQFLPHVFEPFRQAESSSTRVHGGLGLGLSIVRYLVEAHGGSVSAESRGRGEGSTFTVTLPVAGVQPESLSSGEDAGGGLQSMRLSGVPILIVDDDRDTRDMVRAVLLQAGAAVTAADSASAALEQIGQRVPALLLTDIAMPTMDGYQLTRAVRAMPAAGEMKIVALTAFPEGAHAAERAGFDAYLRKPIDPQGLIDALVEVLDA